MSLTKEIRLRALPPRSPLSGTGVSGLTHFCSSWLAFTHCKGRAGGSKGDRKARQPSFWKAAGEPPCTETTATQPAADPESTVCTHRSSLCFGWFSELTLSEVGVLCCRMENLAVKAFICQGNIEHEPGVPILLYSAPAIAKHRFRLATGILTLLTVTSGTVCSSIQWGWYLCLQVLWRVSDLATCVDNAQYTEDT